MFSGNFNDNEINDILAETANAGLIFGKRVQEITGSYNMNHFKDLVINSCCWNLNSTVQDSGSVYVVF